MLSKLDRRLFQVGSILLPILVAIIMITEPYSTGFRIFAAITMIGFFWECQVMLHDWEYVKAHEVWKLALPLDDSLKVVGSYVIGSDTSEYRLYDGRMKHFGRWTVFTDPNTGVRFWRDNLRLKTRWYVMA